MSFNIKTVYFSKTYFLETEIGVVFFLEVVKVVLYGQNFMTAP